MITGITDERFQAEQFDLSLASARELARTSGKPVFLIYNVVAVLWSVEQLSAEGYLSDQPILHILPGGGVYPEWDRTPGAPFED